VSFAAPSGFKSLDESERRSREGRGLLRADETGLRFQMHGLGSLRCRRRVPQIRRISSHCSVLKSTRA
jgi:hypothetical protein